MRLFLLPAAAGLLLTAAFPRANQAWLGWAAWIPLILFVARAGSRRSAFLGGWLAGFVEFFILLRWMPEVMVIYGGMPSFLSWAAYAALIAALACYPAAACAFTRHLMFRRGERCLLLFPFVWIVMELAASVSPFGGFPWLLAGYTQTRFLPVIQIADITGIYGVSFLLLCVNTAIAWFIHKKASFICARLRRGDKWNPLKISALAPLMAAAVLVAGALIYGHAAVYRWGKSEAPFQAALLQGNFPLDEPYEVLNEKFEHTYARMADSLTPGSVDVLILPESPTPKLFQSDQEYRRAMENLARRYTFGMVLSNINFVKQEDGTEDYFNSAFFLAGDGSLSGVYDKIHLVPFGEYIPYKKLLFFAETVTKEMGGFSEGRELQILPLGGRPANAAICFEAVFPDLVRRFAARGSQVIVNLTNDGWYGISDAPYQHLEIARVRAVENRRYFLRAANTGFSAVIDPAGRIASSTNFMEEAICLGRFGFIEEKTFYSRYGNVFVWLCVIISAAAGIWTMRGRNVRK
jgi:apolipoprotein N-acyltransferase